MCSNIPVYRTPLFPWVPCLSNQSLEPLLLQAEITLDDLWCLDCVKMDGWKMVQGNTVGEEMFVAQGPGSSSEDDGEGDSSDD